MSKHTNRWSENDRQAFADGVRLRAATIQGRRFDGPEADEWDWAEAEARWERLAAKWADV